MARITASTQEIIDIMVCNENIPDQITNIKAEENGLSFNINTKLPLINLVPAKVKYVAYEDNHVHLKMSLYNLKGKIAAKVINRIVKMFSKKMGDAVSITYPDIFINVNDLLGKKVKGISIDNIILDNEALTVITGTH